MRSFRSATSYFCQLSGSQQQPGGWKSTIYTKTTRMCPGKDITQHRMANPPQVFIKKQRVSLRWGLVIANMMTRPSASKTTASNLPKEGQEKEEDRQDLSQHNSVSLCWKRIVKHLLNAHLN